MRLRLRIIIIIVGLACAACGAQSLTAISTSVVNIGRAQPVRYGPGVCGPVDPTYIRGATETGGQPFFLSSAEVSHSARIMGATFFPEMIMWASGEREQTYSVPVDSSIERIMIAASFDVRGGTLTVTSPEGGVVRQNAGIEDTPLNCGHIVTIDKPAPGDWQVRVAPSGRYWLVSRAKTEVALDRR